METIWQDLRYGWRLLRRNPGFAVVAVLTLGIGIGANTAIFSVIHAVLLRPLPFSNPQRIVLVWDTDANVGINRGTASLAEFLDWRDQNHVFEELSAFRNLILTIRGKGEPEQLWSAQVSGNFFRLLGVRPVLGRDFAPEEEEPGHGQVIILSYRLWQRRYGGDPQIIGKSIEIDDAPQTVIGVLPQGFSVPGGSLDCDIWTPFALNRAQLDRENHEITVYARLRAGITLPRAQAEMETILARLRKEYPGIDQKVGVHIVRFQDDLVRDLKPALLVLLAAVAFVLLIACANLANLMLARAATREREMAVRAALGAGRGRIFLQILAESVLLALIGGVFGLLVAYGGLNLLRAMLPRAGGYDEIPHAGWMGINGMVLGFTLIVSLFAGMLSSLVPAIQISRLDLYKSLNEGNRGATGGRRSRFVRSALTVSEVALSLMLLVGAGLLIRSLALLLSEDIGFNPSHLLATHIWLPESRYPTGPAVSNFYRDLIDRVAALPGVKSASAVNFLPLTGWVDFCEFDIAGRPKPAPDEQFMSQYRVVDWRFLRTMGVSLKEGRDFAPSDGPETAGVALISEALARRYWPNEDPVGKRIRLHFPATRTPWEPRPSDSWLTIVGVVGDIRDWVWSESKTGQIYLPYVQNPSRIMRLVVRSYGNPAGLASPVRQAIKSVDPNQALTKAQTMDEVIAASVSQRRLSTLLVAVFAALATILAAVGVYGVMAYAVTERAHEIGIRMALGAEPDDVLRMVLADGMRLVGIGLALGLAASLGAMRYLQSQLYGVRATDPLTLAVVAIGLGVVAVAACYIPARRATKVDPLVALRYE